MKDLLVVDCQYDFIDGSLACAHAFKAVRNIIMLINNHLDMKVFYSADWHNPGHCSYVQNGGTWPVHCQANTHGSEIHQGFYQDVRKPAQRPSDSNIFYKGDDDSLEEYSAFEARNKAGQRLCDVVGKDVIVTGIASEFCVRESALALLKSGRNVEIRQNLLGWVDEAAHKKNIEELRDLGVRIS